MLFQKIMYPVRYVVEEDTNHFKMVNGARSTSILQEDEITPQSVEMVLDHFIHNQIVMKKMLNRV